MDHGRNECGRLLIVDDEVELKARFCETLADEGYETVGASNGAEGLKALEKQDFDLLLSDLMMPGNGWHPAAPKRRRSTRTWSESS